MRPEVTLVLGAVGTTTNILVWLFTDYNWILALGAGAGVTAIISSCIELKRIRNN